MLDSERQIFGDRCPKGFTKSRILGKGGIAVVWLCLDCQGNQVAVKQFPKQKGQKGLDPSARVEAHVSELLFNGSSHKGLNSIAKLFQVIEEPKDSWLVYEVGAAPFSKHLFEVKGEFFHGERIYNVRHKTFYQSLSSSLAVLRDFLRLMGEVLDVLALKQVVHADLKPDNILVEFEGERIKAIKLIDFGSAFVFNQDSKITASTPEYLAPEVLQILDSKSSSAQALASIQQPWSYDMWSLGAILLELITGFPIWMSLKCRTVPIKGRSQTGSGIFGVQGRVNAKILAKQIELLRQVSRLNGFKDGYGLLENSNLLDLLTRLLHANPAQRMSPSQLLEHPFLKN